MTVKFSPWGNGQLETYAGVPAVGTEIFTYAAGSSTLLTTYTSATGLVAQTNPIVLDANGMPTGGEIWLTAGQSYKFIWKTAAGVTLRTIDNITGVNDSSSTVSQWSASSVTPTYISASSFTVPGDQTSEFHPARKLQFTVTAGTVYGKIATSTYNGTTLTTVTMTMDSGNSLDSGLSAVNLSILRADKNAMPSLGDYAQSFRLTLTTATPITTSDVTGATTIYATPYKGNTIDLFDGSKWLRYTSAEFSLALGTLTSGKPYDVFCYANAGVPTLEFLVWTNDTTRATGLVYQDGVLVKSGATTRRYLGTFYTTATTTTEDSLVKRFLWNYYHRTPRPMLKTDSTDTWNYTTAAFRQANGNTANQLDYVVGISEDMVEAEAVSVCSNSSAVVSTVTGIGVDSTTTNSATTKGYTLTTVNGSNVQSNAKYVGFPGVGRHFLTWLENSSASGTTTWIGDSGDSARFQTGISGRVFS